MWCVKQDWCCLSFTHCGIYFKYFRFSIIGPCSAGVIYFYAIELNVNVHLGVL